MKKRTVVLVDQGVGFGGSLVVIARLAETLDRVGYRPVIVSAMDWETIRNHVRAEVRAYRVKPAVDYVLQSKIRGHLRRLRFEPLFKLAVYAVSVIEELLNLPSLARTAWIITREGADIVHVNNSLIAVLAARLVGRPVVWQIHGYRTQPTGKPPYFLRAAAHVISISHYMTGLVLRDAVPPSRITTLHNPVAPTHRMLSEDERQRLREGFGFDETHCVVTIVGRVIEWKGQLQFLQAIELVRQRAPNVRALIVGDDDEGYGNYPEQVHEIARSTFPPGTVHFTGYRADVDSCYQASDIVVHASIAPEPFGLVITEAMQNGKPVVGANTGAVPELIDDGIDGFIVDPKDTASLADRILRLVTDPGLRQRCGANALRKVAERFDPQKYAADVARVYDGVLDRDSAR